MEDEVCDWEGCGGEAAYWYDVSGYGDRPVLRRCTKHPVVGNSWKSRVLTSEEAVILVIMES